MPASEEPSPTDTYRPYRVKKACDNCRIRRTKCEPPYPCRACRTARLTDCHVREKARPTRQPRSEGSSASIKGTEYESRINAVGELDAELVRVYEEHTGATINLNLAQGHTHPSLDLDSPLPPLPSISPSAPAAIQAFIQHCLPSCSFLSPTRILHLFDRYSTSASSLSPDQKALVFACLACGYVRVEYFEGNTRNAKHVSPDMREDIPWYRHAVNTLTAWGSATFTSLHALSVLWYHSTLVSTTGSRFIVSWLVSQARELGLHHEQTALAVPQIPTDRPDFMLYIILYAHGHTIGISNLPPLIRPGEFDTIVFNIQTPREGDDPTGLYPSSAIYELTLLHNQLLLNLHDRGRQHLSVEWLLRVEERMAIWSKSWMHARQTAGMIDLFVFILWDWGKILLRTATLHDDRFSSSSMAILARASSQILSRYYLWYTTQSFNLMWQQMRHTVTCAHITLLCYMRLQLLKEEAESSLAKSIWILNLFEPRWTTQVRSARTNILEMTMAFGLEIPQIQTTQLSWPAQSLQEQATLENDYFSGLLFTDATDGGSTLDPTIFEQFFS